MESPDTEGWFDKLTMSGFRTLSGLRTLRQPCGKPGKFGIFKGYPNQKPDTPLPLTPGFP